MIVDRAITLTQPWATLMACGAKQNETRSRPTKYRGWLAIHAAKSFPRECVTLCYQQPFAGALTAAGIEDLADLPRGEVIAVVEVFDCMGTVDAVHRGLSFDERAFGDYSDGRYAYLTRSVRRLRKPIPARGFQIIPWRLERPITEEDLP